MIVSSMQNIYILVYNCVIYCTVLREQDIQYVQ